MSFCMNGSLIYCTECINSLAEIWGEGIFEQWGIEKTKKWNIRYSVFHHTPLQIIAINISLLRHPRSQTVGHRLWRTRRSMCRMRIQNTWNWLQDSHSYAVKNGPIRILHGVKYPKIGMKMRSWKFWNPFRYTYWISGCLRKSPFDIISASSYK